MTLHLPSPEVLPDLVVFFGRFHPPVVHAPIGFIVALLALELLALLKHSGYRRSIRALLWLSALSSALAIILGTLLAMTGGYDLQLLTWHRWSGVGTGILTFWMIHFYGRPTADSPPSAVHPAYWLCLLAASALVAATGHLGGSLTHGADYLTAYLPGRADTSAPTPEAPDQGSREHAALYARVIQPITSGKCASCHNETKAKGEWRLHTFEDLMSAGKTGMAVIAGDAPNSPMMKRIYLPHDNRKHMPPKGYSQLDDTELEILEWWIAGGAPREGPVPATDGLSMEALAILESDLGFATVEPGLEMLNWEQVQEAAAGLLDSPLVQVRRTSLDSAALSVHVMADGSNNQDRVVFSLMPVHANITELDLGGCGITDTALVHVASFRNLADLRLQETAITDEGIKDLKTLTRLEQLNIYGTTTTDAIFETLQALPALHSLHVWQTCISRSGIETWMASRNLASRQARVRRRIEALQRELDRMEVTVTGLTENAPPEAPK
ncbi:MAG: c-type cytochrome domain-containing protein [Kiritimatiellia bacterium]|nr:c-type cytochrome domain-containing protein [Kiritimatiellia bacterium]